MRHQRADGDQLLGRTRTLQFSFVADGVETPDRTADFTLMPMRLEGGEQRILADIVNRCVNRGWKASVPPGAATPGLCLRQRRMET